MKSYSELRALYGTLTNNSSTENLSLGDELMNDAMRMICESRPWYFLEKTKTASTVADQQAYDLPFDYKKMLNVTVTVGGTRHSPKLSPSRDHWDWLNSSDSVSSDTPEFYYIFDNQLLLWPIPSSSTSNAITYSYLRGFRDMNVADYTTGTVDSVTGTAVTGSATSWTTPMAGRYIRITNGNTASSSGDGAWYEISSVGSGTALTLVNSYNGTALTAGAGASYTIGDIPVLPEAYQVLPVYSACEFYFSTKTEDINRSQYFKRKYDEGIASMASFYGRKTSNVALIDTDTPILNPNNYISL